MPNLYEEELLQLSDSDVEDELESLVDEEFILVLDCQKDNIGKFFEGKPL